MLYSRPSTQQSASASSGRGRRAPRPRGRGSRRRRRARRRSPWPAPPPRRGRRRSARGRRAAPRDGAASSRSAAGSAARGSSAGREDHPARPAAAAARECPPDPCRWTCPSTNAIRAPGKIRAQRVGERARAAGIVRAVEDQRRRAGEHLKAPGPAHGVEAAAHRRLVRAQDARRGGRGQRIAGLVDAEERAAGRPRCATRVPPGRGAARRGRARPPRRSARVPPGAAARPPRPRAPR